MVFAVPPAYDRQTGFNTYDLTLPYRLSASFEAQNGKMVDLPSETSHQNSGILIHSEDRLKAFEEFARWAQWLGEPAA